MSILFVFLDGVGVGPDDPDRNPFLRTELPTLRGLLGGAWPTLSGPEVVVRREGPAAGDPTSVVASSGTGGRPRPAVAFPLDATLGVDGTPQSGTGQAALLTGHNAPRIFGRHFGPWTPVRLRPLVEEESVLRRVRDAGGTVAFANAYPRGWPGLRGGRRMAGPPLAARGAGVLDRHEEALGEGHAVSSEIVNEGWQRHLGHDWLPDVTAEEAGANLAAIANQADLTLYAHYATDAAGHEGNMPGAVAALDRLDAFLGGVVRALSEHVTLLVASDHGNLEDLGDGHTTNPVLCVAAGPAAHTLRAGATSLLDVSPAVLGTLGSG